MESDCQVLFDVSENVTCSEAVVCIELASIKVQQEGEGAGFSPSSVDGQAEESLIFWLCCLVKVML